jgi:hypothetical protein
LLFMLVIGTNWVDNDLALGAFRTAVSQAAQAGSLEGAPGGPVAACLAAWGATSVSRARWRARAHR